MADQLRPSLWTAMVAVIKRRWLTYIRYPSWFISMLIWPLLFPFGYIFSSKALAGPDGAALATFGSLAGTTDYAGFIAIGTTFWMWFNMMLWNLGFALRDEQVRGTLESNWLAPVPKVFLLLGSFVTEALMGLVMVGISALTIYLIWGVRLAGSFWHLALIILASIPSIYGIGMIFASIVLVAKEINALIFFIRGLMTVFCGITYPVAVLPGWMRSVSQALPLTHSISGVRAIVAGQGLGAIASQLRFLTVSGAVLIAAGFATFAFMQRHLTDTGTIGQY